MFTEIDGIGNWGLFVGEQHCSYADAYAQRVPVLSTT